MQHNHTGDKSVSIRPLGTTDVDQCFQVATEVFVSGSTLHRALNIGLEEYRDYLWPSFVAMVSEGLSVVAKDQASDQVLGCLIVTRFHPEPVGSTEINEKFTPLSALTSELVANYLDKRELKPGEAALVDMGAVLPEASGLGVYKAMREQVNRTVRDNEFRYILGELSSQATQHVVLDRMGHRRMAEVSFADFKHNGTVPFASITQPPSIIMSEGDVPPLRTCT